MSERKVQETTELILWSEDGVSERIEFKPGSAGINEKSIGDALVPDLDQLRAFAGVASPTNVQLIAIVKVLCRVATRLARLQLRRLEGTD